MSLASEDQILTGTSGDDVILGAAGNDTVSVLSGNDVVLTFDGDDQITIDGNGEKTIYGGSGSDELSISYEGVQSLKDFVISKNGSTITLTDAVGNIINYESIESLIIDSLSYELVGSTTINSGDGGIGNAYWSSTEKALIAITNSIWYAQNIDTAYSGLSASDDFEYIGSGNQDTINLNINRLYDHSGAFNIRMEDGNDSIGSAKFINADQVDMGGGDDHVSVMVSGTYGTPSLASFNMANLDGGAGSDTLSFEESTTNGADLSLTLGGAVNFENLTGTSQSETLRGDAIGNILIGNNGADILYGEAGSDELYADDMFDEGLGDTGGYLDSDDVLYGGDGDDLLVGNAGNNTLDGGTGQDEIRTGNGLDTIVLRAGDGGATVSEADVVVDFRDGSDIFGLDDGLLFSQLTIEGGTGDYANDTIISSEGEYLVRVVGIASNDLGEADFEPVAI